MRVTQSFMSSQQISIWHWKLNKISGCGFLSQNVIFWNQIPVCPHHVITFARIYHVCMEWLWRLSFNQSAITSFTKWFFVNVGRNLTIKAYPKAKPCANYRHEQENIDVFMLKFNIWKNISTLQQPFKSFSWVFSGLKWRFKVPHLFPSVTVTTPISVF